MNNSVKRCCAGVHVFTVSRGEPSLPPSPPVLCVARIVLQINAMER